MDIRQYVNKSIGIRCDTKYKKWLLWQDCLECNIKCNIYHFNTDGIAIYTIITDDHNVPYLHMGTRKYFAQFKPNVTILDYEVPENDVQYIRDGIVFKQKGNRTIARLISNGKVVAKRSSICHKEDEFNSIVGKFVAVTKLLSQESEECNE